MSVHHKKAWDFFREKRDAVEREINWWRTMMEAGWTDKPPNPGSKEAQGMGCSCPVLDNGHGKGSGMKGQDGEPIFWVNGECKIHGSEARDLFSSTST